MNCQDCKYFMAGDLTAAMGACRRFPKTPHGWPMVYLDEWCGEWKQREDYSAMVTHTAKHKRR